ncbi:MAG: type I restriction endonuclease subunit R [Bdellovibrionales bacterium]|nr:type I restriction endonuclease subunit R [Bdellovibrionales bacterium]
MAFITEAELENLLLDQLKGIGYTIKSEEEVGPDGTNPLRESHDEVIYKKILAQAINTLNPSLPDEAKQDAVRKITQSELPNLLAENRRIHRLITDGVDVEYYAKDGTLASGKVKIIDFETPSNNEWLAISQFVVINGQNNRRPDVVVFVNGLPIVVVELKAPGSENATVDSAFNQLQTYKEQIPQLFYTNAALVISDGIISRVGSLSSDFERFMPWRTKNGKDILTKGHPEQETLIEGVLAHDRILRLIRDFTVFGEAGSGLIKIIAGYHQFHAALAALGKTIEATKVDGSRKVGVIWHTQGSGKSFLMAFYAGQLVRSLQMKNPTIVIITDRNDLDEQLFGTFSLCKDLIYQVPVRAESRSELRELLNNRAAGGVIFTTIQKFAPEDGKTDHACLTDRENVVVIADEAHRTQYGFRAKVDSKTGQVSYGFAKYLRDALPKASYIGFTGTPVEATDVNTPAVFGNYIDIYDISRAVEDGATVPIYYESRLVRIELDEDEKPKVDEAIEELLDEYEDPAEREREKQKIATIEALVGSDARLEAVAQDIVKHFEDRLSALDGKAMIVCMSRRICVRLYEEIVKIRPGWHSEDDNKGAIKVVMTGSASDPLEWQKHVGSKQKQRRELLAKRAKDSKDPLKIVIVRDMWLTGFDAPCMHTMYVDKPMQGHGLMQAIARVNRVFRDKPAGLIVDYIGIAQKLKSALGQYSKQDQEKTGIDEGQAIAALKEKYEIVRDMFHGFDYKRVLGGKPDARLKVMAEAIEWILDKQNEWARSAKTPDDKKKAHRRYQDSVLALSIAFSLASASNEAQAIREEVGFFQAIREALVKSVSKSGKSKESKELAIRQIINQAIVSTEIVDILKAAGLKSPDISILSEEFLLEVQNMDKKNLALEALRRLLEGDIKSRSRTNIVETRAFTERLEAAVARYHAGALTTAEVIQELIGLAKDIRAARTRGEETGLTDEEIAFYDALAENQSAIEVLGDDKLKLIAHEVLVSLKQNVSVDWAHRESARARLRVLVKKILRKYGYPPDLQDAAVQTVLQQAEVLCKEWMPT